MCTPTAAFSNHTRQQEPCQGPFHVCVPMCDSENPLQRILCLSCMSPNLKDQTWASFPLGKPKGDEYVHHVCIPKTRRGVQTPETEAISAYETRCGWWEPDLSFNQYLQEQKVLLAAGLPLQPQINTQRISFHYGILKKSMLILLSSRPPQHLSTSGSLLFLYVLVNTACPISFLVSPPSRRWTRTWDSPLWSHVTLLNRIIFVEYKRHNSFPTNFRIQFSFIAE